MALKTEILAQALREYSKDHGRGSWAYLENVSGVFNLKRISTGKSKPTFDTWNKLYRALPSIIPEPVFEKNVQVVSGIKGDNNVQTGNVTAGGDITTTNLSPKMEELVELLSHYASPAEIEQLIKKYRGVKKEIKGSL